MATMTDNPAEVGLHVFERAGLGKAPFRCVGFSVKTFKAHPDAPTQPGTSCDFCGQGIMNVASIRSADGKMFKVGCDCVAKTGDAGLIRQFKNRPEVRAMNKAKRVAKDERVIAEWKALMADEANIAKLSAIMVPGRPWVPGEQISVHQRLTELWGMCGAAGRGRTLKALKARLAA